MGGEDVFVGGVGSGADGSEAVEGGDAEGGGEVAVGAAAGGGFVDGEAELGGEFLRLLEEGDGAGLALHWRAVEAAGDFYGAAGVRWF